MNYSLVFFFLRIIILEFYYKCVNIVCFVKCGGLLVLSVKEILYWLIIILMIILIYWLKVFRDGYMEI